MNKEKIHDLRGLLVERRSGFIDRADISNSSRMKFIQKVPGSEWEEFIFTSDVPLRKEEIDHSYSGSIKYPVYCRRSAARILIMSLSKRIVYHMLENNLSHIFTPKFRHVSIAVDHLVKALVKHPTKYSISAVHARLPAFGSSLRSASLYGDDLGDAAIFQENIQIMNCFSCGLKYADGGPEIVRLGTGGSISFRMYSEKAVTEVEDVLRFLRQNGYLPTQIWENE